jgi:hypothetical protein
MIYRHTLQVHFNIITLFSPKILRTWQRFYANELSQTISINICDSFFYLCSGICMKLIQWLKSTLRISM